ncbi:discoidin domain-containing protein [Kribbella sp. NPDC049174]|uniref:discoidin domain-containing protein n=1 Tax=Kribbella sp. NPDC049174 TaxID=3364112 RepID=UPI00371DD825
MRRTRTTALLAMAAILAAAFMLGPPRTTASAQQVAGSAPFINSWLVSGPFGSPVVDKAYECEVGEVVNQAPRASAITASSSTLAVNPVSYLVDGSTSKQWVTQNDSSPWVNFSWTTPISLTEVRIAQWGDGRHVNNWYHLTFTLADGSSVESGQVDSTSASPSTPTVYSADPGLKNVVGMKIEIDKGRTPYPSITGLSEVEVYDRPVPVNGKADITPRVGEPLGFGGENHDWEYFDDRIYNRNYDDYQDLYGYYSVKKGVDTRNKYVYASTYVYSPEDRAAYFDVGASGSYRIYVNDRCMTPPSTPVEVQKDLTKLAVHLRQGWNKLMIQIKHTYTEDVNSNGVPIAKDQNVAYLGFYGRVADQSGNAVNGLANSVAGPSESLKIVSQGLSTDDPVGTPLPRNNMPTGYKEWPYVWNKSTRTANHGVAASAFQFMAAGGKPGYTWKIVDGRLPDGLELNADGTIADGLVGGKPDLNSTKGVISGAAATGDYNFTVQVTDSAGSSATKTFTTTVKERPNKWFEEGRVGALTHATPTYDYFVDPNYSVDLWAARAKRQGHSLVSIEALQQNYFWPSKFADPKHIRQLYLPKDGNGLVVDGLKRYEQAVKRYGMKFGLYYATEGGGLQHYSTDVFVQNVEDLMGRYDPAYLYFDGPQAMPNANYDVMYSAVRDHSNDIVIDSNAWGEEYGDPDLRTGEASGIYSNAGANHLVKRTPMEPWKMIRTKNQQSPYYGQRDDFRQVTKEMIMNAGRGYVDNNDQSVIDSRGPNWNSPTEISTRYPKGVQEFIDVREHLADWFAPAGLPERHESTTGTAPYFLAGYGYEDDGRGNYEKFAFPNSATGPQWGYATARDNNIFLHVLKGPDGKKGFDAIAGRSLTIRPVKDRVTSVTWLNRNVPVTSFSQTGDSLTINLADIDEDPIDTIIKIVTDSPAQKYKLTNVVATGKRLAPRMLRVEAEGYMTFPALEANLSAVRYASADPGVAKVEPSGIVTPVSDGTTTITVTGAHEGVTKSDALKVSVKNGVVFVGEDMIGASLLIGGKEAYGEFGLNDGLRYALEGRSAKGGAIGLDAAKITWHGGIVDLAGGDKYTPVAIKEVDTFKFEKNKIVTPQVDRPTRGVVWADVTLNGKTVTTNRVFLDLQPYRNLGQTAEVTAGDDQDALANLTDGETIDATHFDSSKWSAAAGTPTWIQFKLPAQAEFSNLELTYNTLDQRYLNTPKTIKIQTSVDGASWTDVSTVNGPTGNAYFGTYSQYPLNVQGQYVRLVFDGGSNGSAIDLLEVAVNGR